MKEGAPAGKRSVAEPCLPSAKEGGIEGREGILALSIERITALCSREIHPPVRAGQFLPRRVLIILLKSQEKIKSEEGKVTPCFRCNFKNHLFLIFVDSLDPIR